jgi:PAS domain S-box-containing protein
VVSRRKLLESPEVQRIIVANVPTIVLVLDEQGRIAMVNDYFEKKTGFAAEAIVGKDWFSTFIPEADRPEIQGVFAKVIEQGANPGHVNHVITADGGRLSVEWFAQVITDPQRHTQWLLNVGHDITERLEYEKALETRRREAQRANATKTRFLAAASHDLRQPVQTLMILNEVLTRLAHDPEQREMLEMQQEILNGMRDLLNALLDIGKLESGAVKPVIRPVPVEEILAPVRAELGPLAADKQLEFVVEPSTAIVCSDPVLLTQVVQNVVGNAVRYTAHGSVRVACEPSGDALVISVADTGVGVGEGEREPIFDEFYRVESKTDNDGLGLGLSIVKRIAELLDCEIALESELGKGTTFRLRVPMLDMQASPRHRLRTPWEYRQRPAE